MRSSASASDGEPSDDRFELVRDGDRRTGTHLRPRVGEYGHRAPQLVRRCGEGKAEVTVVARSQTESTSLVSVRVGTFGDAALQGAMLQKMRDHLKADAATRPAPSTGPAPVHVVDTEASRA